jgi:hypothetical protein
MARTLDDVVSTFYSQGQRSGFISGPQSQWLQRLENSARPWFKNTRSSAWTTYGDLLDETGKKIGKWSALQQPSWSGAKLEFQLDAAEGSLREKYEQADAEVNRLQRKGASDDEIDRAMDVMLEAKKAYEATIVAKPATRGYRR